MSRVTLPVQLISAHSVPFTMYIFVAGLKQHQCLTLEKDKVTLEITNIKVGPMLSKCA